MSLRMCMTHASLHLSMHPYMTHASIRSSRPAEALSKDEHHQRCLPYDRTMLAVADRQLV